MKPPICAVCYKEFLDSDEGGLIYFKKRKSDKKWESAMRKEGLVGHPPYAEWFCVDHYNAAKKLKDLPINEAMAKLREKFPTKIS